MGSSHPRKSTENMPDQTEGSYRPGSSSEPSGDPSDDKPQPLDAGVIAAVARRFLADAGKKGGSVKSEKKAKAAARNGRRYGGRKKGSTDSYPRRRRTAVELQAEKSRDRQGGGD